MKLLVAVIAMTSASLVVGQEAQPPIEKKAEKAKPSIVFLGKTYFLGDNITANKTIAVNRYYIEKGGPGKLGSHLLQRFILTKDDAKTVATKMAEVFKKKKGVTLVHDVAPGISGVITTEAGEKVAFVRVSIFEQAKNGKGVFVKSWDIAAPAMAKEKLEAKIKNIMLKIFILSKESAG